VLHVEASAVARTEKIPPSLSEVDPNSIAEFYWMLNGRSFLRES
jgi:hypothetical protein